MHYSPFILERHFAKYEFTVPYQLSCSDCEPMTLSEILSMASPEGVRLWETLKFSYTDSAGHPTLRKEICSLYNQVEVDDVLVCVPEEGIFLVMNSLLKRGDHLVVVSPTYQSLYEVARGLGCRISRWEPGEDGIYRIQDMKSLVTAKTRMVVINFPHNPTGITVSAEQLQEISGFCEATGIILFSDEMYRGLEQDPSRRLPAAADLGTTSVSLSGMSKSFALPGLRIGWLVCRDPETINKFSHLKDYTTICSSAPSEILAIIALQNSKLILERNLTIIGNNIRLVEECVSRNPEKISWKAPLAGSVAMLNLRQTEPVEEFCQGLLEQKEVLAIGSYLFKIQKPGVRLGLGRADFEPALNRLEEFISKRNP